MSDLFQQIASSPNELFCRIMNPRFVYKLCGYLSVLVGIVAMLCIYRIQFLYYGVGLSIVGFILSGINIFLNLKYEYDEVKYPLGYLGMFLSSLPVVFLMLVIFKFRK